MRLLSRAAAPAARPVAQVVPPACRLRVPGYEVRGELGRGGVGVGVVYKAWHLRLNRPVALKMLLAGPCARADELERFRREAEAAQVLGVSAATVNRRLNRGLQLLLETLDDLCPENRDEG